MMLIKNPSRLNPSERCLTVMGVYYLMRCGPHGFSLCRQLSLFVTHVVLIMSSYYLTWKFFFGRIELCIFQRGLISKARMLFLKPYTMW